MAYWLMKSEPSSYSWDDLVRDGTTMWDGVRNNAARLHLRAMKPGDKAFFYHSMPKGAYTQKQERKADHIAEGYRDKGVSKKEAESRAWATVNKQDKGGKNAGHGRSSSRSAAAKKGWETRRRRGNG